ncbi:MAG: DUF5131 family protein [Alphaproteobacteria bacterium]|nr:DUF5131 family protein [Alphaproteobacteria bacterium]
MSDKTRISWTDATWNPIVGCKRVTHRCQHCYAERGAPRLVRLGLAQYDGLTRETRDGVRWTGKARWVEAVAGKPLGWRKARRIFINAQSDIAYAGVKPRWRARIWWIIGQCAGFLDPSRARGHEFQILTGRPQGLLEWTETWADPAARRALVENLYGDGRGEVYDWMSSPKYWPDELPNLLLGVSVCDQAEADAARETWKRLKDRGWRVWVSYEPALGPVDWTGWEWLDWLVIGGESGPDARPCERVWLADAVAWAAQNGVPCFVKQLGDAYSDPANGVAGPRLKVDSPPPPTLRLDRAAVTDPTAWGPELRVREFPKGRI